MKWNNAASDGLPKDGQRVLMSVKGIYYVAVYHKKGNVFRVTVDGGDIDYTTKDGTIYWTEFLNTPPGAPKE